MTRRVLPALAGAVVSAALTASSYAALFPGNVAGQVDQANYTYYLDSLLYTHTGDDRGFGPEHDLARDNIFSSFTSFGLETTLHPFVYNNGTYYNVVATHPGTVRPDEIFIIGAHYDSVSNPGADDNASGVAAVLESARVMSRYPFESTLVFIAFDREENGLRGSRAYASEHSGDDIQGMLSLDMIAYNHNGTDRARIYGRAASNPFKLAVGEAIDQYGGGLSWQIEGQLDASDHAPFEWEGFMAALLIEDGVWDNPHYHQATDSVDTPNYIDYLFATRMTGSMVGYFAAAAGLMAVPEPRILLLLILGMGTWKIYRRRRRAALSG